MKDILILGYFIPNSNVGGPYNSINNLVNKLKTNFNFKIISPNVDLGKSNKYTQELENVWQEKNGIKVLYLKNNIFSFFYLIKQIKKISTNNTIIYLQSVFNFTFSISVVLSYKLRLIRCKKILIIPRGEIFNESLHFKKKRKKIFIILSNFIGLYNNIFWHASNLKERECLKTTFKISENYIKVASMLTNYTEKVKLEEEFNEFENGVLKIIWLARISADKNFLFAIEILSRIKNLEIQFDIFGTIEDKNIWESSLKIILPANIHKKYIGVLPREEVRKTLAKYDLFFLPTFSENFGHSIAESLSVGTPVLISDNTPWNNLEEEGFGWDINLNEKEKFVKVIEDFWHIDRKIKTHKRKNIITKIEQKLNDPKLINDNLELFL